MFHVSLPEQNITKKGREFLVSEFEQDDNKKYEVEAIQDSAVYAKEEDRHPSKLYYLITWKRYLEKKNT